MKTAIYAWLSQLIMLMISISLLVNCFYFTVNCRERHILITWNKCLVSFMFITIYNFLMYNYNNCINFIKMHKMAMQINWQQIKKVLLFHFKQTSKGIIGIIIIKFFSQQFYYAFYIDFNCNNNEGIIWISNCLIRT
jgi:hypothetical protein